MGGIGCLPYLMWDFCVLIMLNCALLMVVGTVEGIGCIYLFHMNAFIACSTSVIDCFHIQYLFFIQ